MHTSMSVSRLLQLYPYAEDALDWHGIEHRDLPPTMTIEELMRIDGVDGSRLLSDLRQVEMLYEGEEAWEWAQRAIPVAANDGLFDDDELDAADDWRWSDLTEVVA